MGAGAIPYIRILPSGGGIFGREQRGGIFGRALVMYAPLGLGYKGNVPRPINKNRCHSLRSSSY